MFGCKALKTTRNEAYFYTLQSSDEHNAAGGRFSTA
jgi:hypothetical protein